MARAACHWRSPNAEVYSTEKTDDEGIAVEGITASFEF